MKLPKGIKRMRLSASEEAMEEALKVTTGTTFNGYIRTTAPKGVKEAGIVLYLEGRPRLAVFQSPERSLYGPDALAEVRRISSSKKAFIRVEEFLAQNLDEVQTIVAKMRKARIDAIDVERTLQGVDVEAEVPEEEGAADEVTAVAETPVEGEAPTEDEVEPAPPVPPIEELPEEPPKVGKVRAKVTERITKSKAATKVEEDEDEFLQMMKEVGMTPPGEEEDDDEVTQYIAAFEDFLTRKEDGQEGVVVTEGPPQMAVAADEIIDEMLEAASEDPEMMAFIEGQRERILNKVAIEGAEDETAAERHDRLSEQRSAIEHISYTFQEVLAASEIEAERRRTRLEKLRGEEEEGSALLVDEEKKLEESLDRSRSLGEILNRVMDTHIERMESAAEEMEVEREEELAGTEAEAVAKAQRLDLEAAKEGFLDEMRTRIRTVSTEDGEDVEPGEVAEAVQSVSDGIQDRVRELEQERDALTSEQAMLEDRTEDLEGRRDTMEVDMELEVSARLRELEDRERSLHQRSEDLEALESRLEEERARVEGDLERARQEQERITQMEDQLQDRERIIEEKDKELDDKHTEVDGLKEHLEEEIAQRASELEDMEAKLKAQEEELLSREADLTRSVEQVKREREEDEQDLQRVEGLEEELRRREEEYTSTISNMEQVIEALREELRENIEKAESLEEEMRALRDAEGRVEELEERLAAAEEAGPPEGAPGIEKEDLRKLLSYLDDLLSNLPDSEIEKFSKTEYFELYGRILDKLGI